MKLDGLDIVRTKNKIVDIYRMLSVGILTIAKGKHRMAVPVILTGANCRIYINNTLYKQVQGISFTIDYAETDIYGIDVPYRTRNCQQQGNCYVVSVTGMRVKLSGGIQAVSMRPLFYDTAASPYVSLRIQDRATQEDIIFIPNAKITMESHTIQTKSTYKLNFNFVGQVPLMALDRA